jgi:hypothetical protein
MATLARTAAAKVMANRPWTPEGGVLADDMDGKGACRVFVERLWRSIKYEEVYLRAYDSVSEARSSVGRYLDFYNSRRPIRVLTAPRRIKPTSPRYHSAWQPNPGRGSTYRRGNSVQTTGTSAVARSHISPELSSPARDYCDGDESQGTDPLGLPLGTVRFPSVVSTGRCNTLS